MYISNSYTVDDFILSDDLEVSSVKTVLSQAATKSGQNLKNILITHLEKSKIVYHTTSNIFYQRLNHVNFHYEINLKNPRKKTGKVIIRLWLGPLMKEKDIR